MNKQRLTILVAVITVTACVQMASAYPPMGYDNINTSAHLDIYDPSDSNIFVEGLNLGGWAVIHRSDPYDPGDGRIQIDTRLDTLYLVGYSVTFGDSIYITLNRNVVPNGEGHIRQMTPGIDFPAESFFDVYYQITIGPPGPTPPKALGTVPGGFHIDPQTGQGEAEFQMKAGSDGGIVSFKRSVPPKAPYTGPNHEGDAAGARVGGDVIASATPIPALPYSDVATTIGFIDDYDEICPYNEPGSPDVVYSFAPPLDTFIQVSLCDDATDYDTKLYVYENGVSTLVDCNDDWCSTLSYPDPYVSELQCIPVSAGNTYYIIVDGYGGEAGTYGLTVDYCIPQPPCSVFCPPNAFLENEACGFQNNDGCNMAIPAFEPINCGDTVCGTIWADVGSRDTDWYQFVLTSQATITVCGSGEFPMVVGFVDTADCALASQVDPATVVNPCDTGCASRTAGPGTYWMFVSANQYDGYPCGTDNDYWAALTCVAGQIVLINPDSARMADTIWQIPPHGREYKDPRKVAVIDPNTGDTIAWVWHKHVVNPPEPGPDTVPTTGTMAVWQGPNPPGPTQPPDDIIQLQGEATVQRGPINDGVIQTEIVQMDLVGNSPLFGPTILSLPAPAPGEASQIGPELFPMESFFDVDYRVEFPNLGQTIEPITPPHMEAQIEALPPYNRKYNANPEVHPIQDSANPGPIIGWVRPIHWVQPQVGACCDLVTGDCRETTPADCDGPDEIFLGIGIPCDPNPCPEPPISCCNHDGIRGDVNGDLTGPNVADLTYLVDYLFRGGPPPPCLEEGDVNGDGGNPNVADLTYLVDFLFRSGPPPAPCP